MGELLAPLQQWAAGVDTDAFWWTCALLAAAALGGGWLGFRRLRRARLIEDTPTQRLRSAAQGYVEFEGVARWIPGPEIRSPLSRTACVWWRYAVEQRRGSGKNARWHRLEGGTSDDLFLLDDATGECVIDPEGAQVYPDVRRQWRGGTRRPLRIPAADRGWLGRLGLGFGSYRYSEQLISLQAPLHALGQFSTVRAARAEDAQQAQRELLAEWKQNQQALLARFDANGDGEIDLDEWERVRAEALETVRRQAAETPAPPDTHVLRKPGDGRAFLLSTWPQDKLARYKRISAAFMIAGAAIAVVLLAILLETRLTLN